MMRHLFKLVWNRKRINALVILEIVLSFLVVFVVSSVAVSYARNYSRPLGFEIDHVWQVQLDTENDWSWQREQIPTLQRLLHEVELLDPVEAISNSSDLPYDGSTTIYRRELDGRDVTSQQSTVSEGFNDVFRLDLVHGRWFEEADLAQDWTAVVINQDLARDAFGDEDPLGRSLSVSSEATGIRVVGVVRDFRKVGELSAPENFTLELYRVDSEAAPPLTSFAVRLHSSTTAAFEEQLVRHIESHAPGWTVQVKPMEQLRRDKLNAELIPLITSGVVAAFLMLMVALGLIGVLWQNVTQRTREIGLRRAAGADQGQIHRQILMEVLLMTTIGVLLGIAIVAQLPLLQLWGFGDFGVFGPGLLVSLALIYLLAALSGLYPSWMATRIRPAEALHYE